MGFITILWIIALVMLGAVVAPVAAVSCAVAARYRRLSWSGIAYFAGAGALYGVFVTGWIYVLARTFNRSLPLPVMVVAYFLPYVSWICFVAGGIGLEIYEVWGHTLGFGGISVAPGATVGSAVWMSMLLGGIAAGCLFSSAMSLRDLARRYKRDRARRTEATSLDFGYIKPFLYLACYRHLCCLYVCDAHNRHRSLRRLRIL